MAKGKKLTYNELANYIIINEKKFTNALNTVGQTITDYIEFKKDKDKFIGFLKKKYKDTNPETKEST